MLKTIKKSLKYLGYSLLFLLAFVGLYLLMAALLSRIPTAAEKGQAQEVEIFLLTNGVHTDIVMPLKNDQADWTTYFNPANTLAKDSSARYLSLGWGDKGFYLETPTWADLTFPTAFKAAFGLSHAAVHATFYRQMKLGEDCKRILISREQYGRLAAYVVNTLKKTPEGLSMYIDTDANYGKFDAFYEANGSYHLFHTCNTWANNGLKACGQKACLWTPFDKGIFYQYKDRP